MNESTAVFLIRDDVRAIEATYEPDESPKLFKTFDPSIKVDDFVVVPTDTRHKMTVCKVTDVDLDIDVETTQTVKWVIGTISPEDFEKLKEAEAEAISLIKHAQKRKRRAELRDALLDEKARRELELTALPLKVENGNPAPPPAPTNQDEHTDMAWHRVDSEDDEPAF